MPSSVTNTASPASALVVNGKFFNAYYQQSSAEYKALCFQAYNLARQKLDMALNQPSPKRRAIITDVDETILDNSPYAIKMAQMGLDYDPLSWSAWIDRSEADSIAGSVSFLRYASAKGVEVFYITNRDEKDRNGTQKNIEFLKYPTADQAHLIMRQGSSSKEARRQEISAIFDVVLYLGDNLTDFPGGFDRRSIDERESLVDRNYTVFGNNWILLPNATYGDWESASYEYNNNYSLRQRDSIIKAHAKTYQ